MDKEKKTDVGYIIQSLIIIGIGVVLVVWSMATLDLLARALAALLILIGAIFIISYFARKEKKPFIRSGAFITGIIIAGVGLWIFLNPGGFTDLIPKLFGVFILISGIRNCGQAISLMKLNSKGWIVALLIALVTIGLGGYLLYNPTEVKDLLVKIIGGFLIADGATNLLSEGLVGGAARRAAKVTNIVDAEHVVVNTVDYDNTIVDTEAVVIDESKDQQ